MLVVTLTCVFHSGWHPFFLNKFAEKFNVVSSHDNVLVHFIDVGQGDASAVNFPNGQIMLIDTGSVQTNTSYVNYLKENVLNTQRGNYIDYLVLTHADMDHCGGTMKLLSNFKIGKIFLPLLESNSQGYQEILNYVQTNCDYEILGDEFDLKISNSIVTFFEIINDANTNDSSQIIKLQSLNKCFLFSGDISKEVEADYIDRYGDLLDVDVLKVSHHGSKTATSKAFLNVTSPDYAVISAGLNNIYGHPSAEVLQILAENDVSVLRTDICDDILFIVGKHYDLYQTSGLFHITQLSLDYVVFVLSIDACLILASIIIVVKKEKKNKK